MTRQHPDLMMFGSFFTEGGRLGEALPLAPLFRPTTIALHPKGNGFSWSARRMARVQGPAPDLLRFIGLADGTDRQVTQFARRYGVLGFCKHEVPYTHSSGLGAVDGTRSVPCHPLIDKGRYFEPFEWWRRMAAEARAILRISTRHQDDKVGDSVDWETLEESPTRLRTKRRIRINGTPLDNERLRLLDYVDIWIMIANVRPYGFPLPSGGSSVGLTGGLAGALAMQLLSAVTRSSGFARCAGCGEFFASERQSSGGRQQYCLNCGRRASTRAASKRYRDKKRQQQRGIVVRHRDR